MKRGQIINLTRLFQQRPSQLELVILKADDTHKRVGSMPFETREEMIDYLRDHPAGPNSVYDLTDKDLSGADLSGANLSGAVMQNTNLRGCNLAGADLSGAQIRNSDMSGTRMIRVDLSKSVISNTPLDGAKLEAIDAHSAEFEQIGLEKKDIEKIFRGFYQFNGRSIQPPGLVGRTGPRPGY